MAYQSKKHRKFVATAATAALVATAVAPAAGFAAETTKDFTDVKGHWGAKAIDYLVGKKAIKGYEDGTFKPDGQITRAEAATVLAGALGLKIDDNAKTNLTDAKNHWASKYIAAIQAQTKGVISGFPDGTFKPEQKISREDMAKMIVAAYPELKLDENADVSFADKATYEEAQKAINILASLGVATGKGANKFEPTAKVTRAETATFVHRAEVKEVREEVKQIKPVAPEVVSVSAINAKQFEIKFNTAMDADSVEDVTNYAIKKAGIAAISFTSGAGNYQAAADLSEDGKTLTITLTNALTAAQWGSVVEGDTFNVELDELKAKNGKKTAAQSVAVKYSDKVAPTFVSAKASGKTDTNSVTLTFSEPVDTSVATATINGTVVAISAGSTPNSVVLTSGTKLAVGTTYNLSLLNFKDFAGNLLSPNPVETTVTVASDVAAPVATSVEVVRDNLLKVTFDKAMNPATLTAGGTVKLLDANLATTGITQGSITPVNSSNKSFYVNLSAVPFNASGNFSGTLVLTDGIKDAAGNALSATTKAVSISKDVVAPQVVSTTYKNVATYNGLTTTNGAIVIKFNESVTASAANTDYKVVNNATGAAIATPISAVNVNPNDSTELVLTLNAAVAANSTTYTVIAPVSAVVDKSLSANPSVAANLTVDVSAGAPVAQDVTAPTIALGTVTAATTSASGTTIEVDFVEAGSGLDTATVINTNNYRLDGLPLPAGSYITLNALKATINIPAGTIAKDKAYNLNVNGIKDKAGNTALAFLGSVALKDDIKPEFTAATLNANGTLSLSFSEAVITGVGKEADFELFVNNSVKFDTGVNKAFTIANGVGSDAGKYVITVATSVSNVADGSVDGTLRNYLYVDVNGNQTYDAGTDILVASTVALAGTADDYTAGTFDLNDAVSIKIATKATPTLVKDTGTVGNVVVGSKSITVK